MPADLNRAAGAWVTDQSRRAVVRVWVLLGIFGASLIGGAVAAQLGWLSSRQGAAAGVGVAALALLAFQAAEQRSRQAIAWVRGSRAEREVGAEIDLLREHGALVLHDIDIDRGNIDHVVVLPRGAYVIETKATRYEARHLKQVKRQALWMRERAGQWMTPVICLASRNDTPHRRDGVWIMGREHLNEWLLAQRGRKADRERVLAAFGL